MPNLELALKTHDLLNYLENPWIYDSGKEDRKILGFKHPTFGKRSLVQGVLNNPLYVA
jgi:hypothetical protein